MKHYAMLRRCLLPVKLFLRIHAFLYEPIDFSFKYTQKKRTFIIIGLFSFWLYTIDFSALGIIGLTLLFMLVNNIVYGINVVATYEDPNYYKELNIKPRERDKYEKLIQYYFS